MPLLKLFLKAMAFSKLILSFRSTVQEYVNSTFIRIGKQMFMHEMHLPLSIKFYYNHLIALRVLFQ